VVRGDHGGRRHLDGLRPVVVLDLDRALSGLPAASRSIGPLRSSAAGGQDQAEGSGSGQGAEVATSESGHGTVSFSDRAPCARHPGKQDATEVSLTCFICTTRRLRYLGNVTDSCCDPALTPGAWALPIGPTGRPLGWAPARRRGPLAVDDSAPRGIA